MKKNPGALSPGFETKNIMKSVAPRPTFAVVPNKEKKALWKSTM